MKVELLIKEYKTGRRDFSGVDLSNQNLSNCILVGVDLSDTNLAGADLSKVIFEKVNLSRANLTSSKLNPADLSCCDLRGANLSNAKLDPKRTKLLNAIYDQDTQFPEGFNPIGASYVGVVSKDISSVINEIDENLIQTTEKSNSKLIENALPSLPPPKVKTPVKNDDFVKESSSQSIDEIDNTQVLQQIPTSVEVESASSFANDTNVRKESLITSRKLFFIGAGIGLMLLIPTILFLKFTETSRLSKPNVVHAPKQITSSSIKGATIPAPSIPLTIPVVPKAIPNPTTVVKSPLTNDVSKANTDVNSNSTVIGEPVSKNIRSGPGTEYGVIAKVNVGDRLLVKGQGQESSGFVWYKVYDPSSGVEGYIGNHLLSVDNATVTSSPTVQFNPTIQEDTNATIVGESGGKNIRSGPGTQYSALNIAYPGDRVKIIESSNDIGGYTWYKVYLPESRTSGWIAAQLINLD